MEFRYLGFDQQGNARVYRFDCIAKGELTRHFIITADMGLFLGFRVGIQEGPTLCANKLALDVENNVDGTHELTSEDFRTHSANRALAELRKAEARKNSPRRSASTSTSTDVLAYEAPSPRL